ncbi:MAG TPA: hypothetical protein PK823_19415 [Novosphingobium sp.]|nr:hypothetical protein [Novosphingobium sp.]
MRNGLIAAHPALPQQIVISETILTDAAAKADALALANVAAPAFTGMVGVLCAAFPASPRIANRAAWLAKTVLRRSPSLVERLAAVGAATHVRSALLIVMMRAHAG